MRKKWFENWFRANTFIKIDEKVKILLSACRSLDRNNLLCQLLSKTSVNCGLKTSKKNANQFFFCTRVYFCVAVVTYIPVYIPAFALNRLQIEISLSLIGHLFSHRPSRFCSISYSGWYVCQTAESESHIRNETAWWANRVLFYRFKDNSLNKRFIAIFCGRLLIN